MDSDQSESGTSKVSESSPNSATTKSRKSLTPAELFGLEKSANKTVPAIESSKLNPIDDERLNIEMSESTALNDNDLTALVKKHEKIISTFFELREPAKLTSTNYETWKEAFDARMRNAALDKIISRDWTPEAMKKPDWKELDQLAKDNVLNNVNGDMASFVRGEATAKAMYDKIVLHYEGNKIKVYYRGEIEISVDDIFLKGKF